MTLTVRALLAVWLVGQPASVAAAERIVVTHASADAFKEATRDRFVAVDASPPRIRLARSFLLSNEMGRTAKYFDKLSASDLARVTFSLPSADVEGAVLLLYYSYAYEGRHPTFIAVNGKRRPYVHDEARMLTGGWARHDIPADELRAEVNEVVIGGGGGLHVDVGAPGGRSARSFDGGRTWKPDALGPDGDWQGEYIVRVRVYGYPPTGQVVGAVIDPAVADKDPVIRPAVRVESATLRAKTNMPAGTKILFGLRSGTTPAVMGRTWTNWKRVELDEPLAIPGHRYVQWRAKLTSDSGAVTPSITSVTVAMEAKVRRPNPAGVSVRAYENPKIVRSSYPFTYESNTPRVRHLREKYHLPDVIAPGKTELEQHALLRKWVSHQWKHGWDDGKYKYVPPWNALELLELAKANLSLGMCTHYSCTFVQAAASLGFVTRSVILDHHCVAEVWSNELGKWLVQDAGPGYGPNGYPVGFMYRAEGQWLNALDVHRALAKNQPVEAVPFKDLKGPWTINEAWRRLFVRFGIPLRNNHLSEPAPAEVEHGRQQYHWDGYLWWTDSVDSPRYEEYSLLSNRVGDFAWTVNQAVLDLRVSGQDALTVNLDTQTPNFDRFEASIDDGPWKAVPNGFPWKLHGGVNRLVVRVMNGFGASGPPSRVVLEKGVAGFR